MKPLIMTIILEIAAHTLFGAHTVNYTQEFLIPKYKFQPLSNYVLQIEKDIHPNCTLTNCSYLTLSPFIFLNSSFVDSRAIMKPMTSYPPENKSNSNNRSLMLNSLDAVLSKTNKRKRKEVIS